MLWALTERGRRIPLNPDPYAGPEPAGLFVLRDRDKAAPTAIAVTAAAYDDEPRYRSHFATCTHPERHRRPR